MKVKGNDVITAAAAAVGTVIGATVMALVEAGVPKKAYQSSRNLFRRKEKTAEKPSTAKKS